MNQYSSIICSKVILPQNWIIKWIFPKLAGSVWKKYSVCDI